jgi:hypothetical protein
MSLLSQYASDRFVNRGILSTGRTTNSESRQTRTFNRSNAATERRMQQQFDRDQRAQAAQERRDERSSLRRF